MARLKIEKIKYEGDNYWFESPSFNNGIVIIEGSNGTGKTTLTSLIYYCLSGDVPYFSKGSNNVHNEIVNDSNNYVELIININTDTYKIRRFIGSNDLTVFGKDESVEVYPIFRTKNEKMVFSDWLLEKLSIDVVDIYQGNISYKINIKDLFRLIYHNQELDPHYIFKQPEVSNFVSDSELLRKTIFQLLVGKKFSEYYNQLTEFKKVESMRNLSLALLNEYTKIVDTVDDLKNDLNIVHLIEQRKLITEQLERLERYKKNLKKEPNLSNEINSEIEFIKKEIFRGELRRNELLKETNSILEELSNLQKLKKDQIIETTHIKKIIYTHEKLNLFSPDTCPYCLREVHREQNKCICGNVIQEDSYQKYFYDSNEYEDLLKRKQKSIETIDLAIDACQNELASNKEKIISQELFIKNNKKNLSKIIDDLDTKVDINKISNVDDQIYEIKGQLFSISQKIAIEEKKNELIRRYNESDDKYKTIKVRLVELESLAKQEIMEIIIHFNQKYNQLMMNALQNCRSAKISLEDYMPIIDNGLYREASSRVPIRLLYYFTLLYLSLKYDQITFPKFLLIDTPETAGIDSDNLIKSINQYDLLLDEDTKKIPHQIILTTGENKYPADYKKWVVLNLSKENPLLRRKEK